MDIIVHAKTNKPIVEPCIDYLVFTDGNFDYIHVDADDVAYWIKPDGFTAIMKNAYDIMTNKTPDLTDRYILYAECYREYPDESFEISECEVEII